MSKVPPTPDKNPDTADAAKADVFAARAHIYRDIMDTTWRMFVPSIGGAVLGVIGDRTFGTKPWLTVAGVTFGFCMVGLLIWLQLRNTKGLK